jgi:hypothetical protein
MGDMTVGVIGGGIFGVTVAIHLARKGWEVSLYERKSDILAAASYVNQYRVHRGYHYPRSAETALACRDASTSFRAEYGGTIIDSCQHYYCIAKKGSVISAEQYMQFCDDLDLEYEIETPSIVRDGSTEVCLKVNEAIFDIVALKNLCWKRLRQYRVSVHLGWTADEHTFEKHRFSIIATYAHLNSLLGRTPEAQRVYQFEVCEKPVVQLTREFMGKSVVVMDGPFMCLGPFGKGPYFVLGDVENAIHQRQVDLSAKPGAEFEGLLDAGVIERPHVTNFARFVESGNRFFRGFDKARHIGSMFTVRTVLPWADATDARPTVVDWVGDGLILVFSGKIPTCVNAAREVERIMLSSLV